MHSLPIDGGPAEDLRDAEVPVLFALLVVENDVG